MSNNQELRFYQVVDLALDPNNPRLPERLVNAVEKDVLNWMLTDATLTDLMASIVENNFFEGEPLVGINHPNQPGKIIIVEGNRRLASVKLLSNPRIAENKIKSVKELAEEGIRKANIPDSLPVYVVASRQDVANYLGFRHVSGVKQWPVIAKARYLNSLFNSRPWSTDIYRQLAKEIGSKSAYVRRLIIGYGLYRIIEEHNFFDLDYLNEENFDLSLITDAATKYSDIVIFMSISIEIEKPLSNLNMRNFTKVYEWLYKKDQRGETRVGESRNLSVLNKILATDNAREAFLNDKYSLADAAALTSLADDNVRYHLQTARISMIEAQKQVHTIKAPNKSDLRLIDEIRSSSDTIRREILDKMVPNEIPK